MNALAVIRRHVAVFSVLAVLTLLGAFAAAALIPPTYTASGSFALQYPATSGSAAIAASAAKNPLLRYADIDTVPELVVARVNGDSVRSAVAASGYSDDYTVSTSTDLNASSQIMDVTLTSGSRSGAIDGVAGVGRAMEAQLLQMQRSGGATSPALITIVPAAIPLDPASSATGAIRSLVGVLGVGAVVIVIVLALLERRRAASRPSAPGAPEGRSGERLLFTPGTGATSAPRPEAGTASGAADGGAPVRQDGIPEHADAAASS